MIYTSKKSGVRYIDISDVNKNKSDELSVISLFTGAGGLDIGLEHAGFNTLVCVENDKHCRTTLKHNRPNWKVFEESTKVRKGKTMEREPGDIRDIDPEEVLSYAGKNKGEVTLVVGGAPCQPFSNMGMRQGKEDEKNGDLFLEFVRFVKGIAPKAFIFENVVGITQQKHADVISYMINKFAGLGYGISYTVLNSANYGVPQRRERFFIIGIKGVDSPAFPLPTHYKLEEKFRQQFAEDLSPKLNFKPLKWKTVKDAFSKIPKGNVRRDDYVVMNISEMVKHRMTYIKQGENFHVLPMELRPDCWKNGAHQGNDTFGRLIENLPSITIRTAAYNPGKGMYIHPNENRGLNSIEMASLQSFPYEWHFKCDGRDKITLVSGGKQIGNAVPPLLAEALGTAIRKQLSRKPIKPRSEKKQARHAIMSLPQKPHQRQLAEGYVLR